MAMALQRFCQGNSLNASTLVTSLPSSSLSSSFLSKTLQFRASKYYDSCRTSRLWSLNNSISCSSCCRNPHAFELNTTCFPSACRSDAELFRPSKIMCSHNAIFGLFQDGPMSLAGNISRSALCSSLKIHDDFDKINNMPETRQKPSKPCKIMSPCRAKKWKDPFDYGEDPDLEYGQMFSEGKQSPEEPIPPKDPSSTRGLLKFPAMYNLEITPLALKVRGDVRRCCCLVAGGVYENLLFFPVIQLLKDRYPGVKIDIMAGERGKQTYEINKNVRRAWVYELEQNFPKPSDYVEGYSKLKEEYYDLIISTRLAGWGHAAFLLLTDATRRLGYVYPNVYSAGAGSLLSEAFKAPSLNLAEAGYNMYADLLEELAKPGRKVPKSKIPPLQVSIGKRVKAVVEEKCKQAGVAKGDYIVFHGIESDSAASMQSKGDLESLLPLNLWATLAKSTSIKALFVIPHEKERTKVAAAIGEDASAIFITTPGQLAALINDSLGVVTTNTAALQLAIALNKPSVALFASAEKARLFIPRTAGRCAVVSSKTGKLMDIDFKAASVAVTTIAKEALVFA
ncbi:hypothetical protein O6H91_17G090900 [Diphasiastrum complanatum]|uniref:Uncharacterized protein n=1 Tax=Diphasiastrum complanatum TaxID=34168 RepID=A0ACC2B950_DIPCM|nr:hypothetical protein O6H91_17G090900 [Diphasiastrum complanatum]